MSSTDSHKSDSKSKSAASKTEEDTQQLRTSLESTSSSASAAVAATTATATPATASASASADSPSSSANKSGESGIRAKFAVQTPPNLSGLSGSSSSKKSITTKPQSSPLLSSTPPLVSKALVNAYPYLLIVNKILSIATWTNEDYWVNVVLLALYALFVLYFEQVVTWLGHLLIAAAITLYAVLNNRIIEEASLRPTLDDVVQALNATCLKADMLLLPITSLSLTAYDIKRLLFTTVFLTPIYLVLTFLFIRPRTILLFTGVFLMTYHSSYSIVIRRILWQIKLVRLICFYLTGLDLSQTRNHSLFAAAFAKVQSNSQDGLGRGSTKPVRFTYVIYENQRRWLGIGWTSNLLSYERTAWTDEFLNESSSIETFKLPNTTDSNNLPITSDIEGASWRWVDKTWRLDLTNDGAITLPASKHSKTTANPTSDEGFVYYDNVWKKPTTEDSFSKYTRRRRWIRTAELIYNQNNSNSSGINNQAGSNVVGSALEEKIESLNDPVKATGNDMKEKKVKNLRFAENSEDAKQIDVDTKTNVVDGANVANEEAVASDKKAL
ncbi:conserved hypothetical protein [Lodderomyces elongisporus NRRL YB-4239]|uniref:Peroxin/Ferlin domain-containing protein n=1 Tax=Lodderomyces elongisporus (strain ATCC 11503 / CBS 2605 / JCM 1781 / NBRC 1676 / NRRL YB-4239) TaxID=379508 RepID=A5DUZ7_LODEL|nr:conserved hypothetical protein [Lodderomyces elongisporus NRRL YB-4239]